LFVVPTTRDVGGGEEEEPPRNSSKECAKTLSSQTLSNQKILSIFHKLHLTDSRHKLHQNHERQKKTGGKKKKSINKILAQKFLFLSNSHLQGLQDDKSPSKQASKQKQRVQLLFQGRSSQIRHENRNSNRADRKKNREEEEEERDGENGQEETEQPAGIFVVKQTKEKVRKKSGKKGGEKRAQEFGGRCSNERCEQRNGNRSGKGKPRRCSRVPTTTREEEEEEASATMRAEEKERTKGIRRFLPFFHTLCNK
jgi:hypothetical protein